MGHGACTSRALAVIARRFSVAWSGVCPPDRNTMPGTDDGTVSIIAPTVSSATSSGVSSRPLSLPETAIAVLSITAEKSTAWS